MPEPLHPTPPSTARLLLPLIALISLLAGCGDDGLGPVTGLPGDTVVVLDPSAVATDRIYVPLELRSMDLYRSSSPWFYGRSRQSEHFIVFWGEGYGGRDPGALDVPAAYRVDIDDLLARAEDFYDLNVGQLEFVRTGVGESKLDQYKMLIFLHYQEEWLATGAGYDDVIGALWVSPATAQPAGPTIAHEIGHSFQYQVHSDLGGTAGFRYGFGGNGGNTFWEQTAQWQAYQSYPREAFASHNFTVYTENHHRHVFHEWQRYASYFIHYYWADKHGVDIISRIWREAKAPEDPIQAYMRITGIDTRQLNAELYEAATRFVTWDLDSIRKLGADRIGAHTFGHTTLPDGAYRVSYDHAPGTTGYNVIPLDVPDAGTEVAAEFTGLVDAEGFNPVADADRAGWRYGFVALLGDGTRVYGDMNEGGTSTSTATFTVPEDCSRLWFVVTGAPTSYAPHAWDEEEGNDDQWPYEVSFSNTDIDGAGASSGAANARNQN